MTKLFRGIEVNIPADPEFKEYFNLEEGLTRVMKKEALYVKLLNSFVQNTYMGKLSSEIERSDIENAAMTAHTIKGIAANLSLTKLYSTVLALEVKLKEKAPCQTEFQQMQSVLAKTVEFANMIINN